MRDFYKQSWFIISAIFALAGTLATIFLIPGEVTIGWNWLTIIGLITLSAICIAILARNKLKDAYKAGTHFQVLGFMVIDNKDTLYCEPNEDLRYGTIVTVYNDEPFDRSICYGIVSNVSPQSVAVELIADSAKDKDTYETIQKNDHRVIKHLYVLPNVYRESIDELAKLDLGDKNA